MLTPAHVERCDTRARTAKRRTEMTRLSPAPLPAHLRYHMDGVPGAMEIGMVAEELVKPLLVARRYVQNYGFDLLLWDGFRTARTQRAIFDAYRETVRLTNPSLS